MLRLNGAMRLLYGATILNVGWGPPSARVNSEAPTLGFWAPSRACI